MKANTGVFRLTFDQELTPAAKNTLSLFSLQRPQVQEGDKIVDLLVSISRKKKMGSVTGADELRRLVMDMATLNQSLTAADVQCLNSLQNVELS